MDGSTQQDPVVLNLIVEEGSYTLRELALAAAEAATHFMTLSVEEEDLELFEEWHSGLYRKLTRRASARDFAKLQEGREGFVHTSSTGVRLFVAKLFRKSTTPKLIARLQLSGLRTLEEHSSPVERARVHIIVNDDLALSAGKATAAAAHAAQKAMQELDNRDTELFLTWWHDGFPLSLSIESLRSAQDEDRLALIEDAGLTEVEPGSPTAAAYWHPEAP